MNKAEVNDIEQLIGYMQEFGQECIAGVLIAADFAKLVKIKAAAAGVKLVKYELFQDWDKTYKFSEILDKLTLKEIT